MQINTVTQVVIQGEYAVSSDPNCMFSTILGSCVATCLFDRVAGVGGMNHFLLPGDMGQSGAGDASSYGLHLMECLINGLLKQGAKRSRLEAKLFGGAYITAGLPDIGSENAQFARKFLAYEGIPCVSSSLGGNSARRIRFSPVGGDAGQKLIVEPNLDQIEQKLARTQAVLGNAGSELELF